MARKLHRQLGLRLDYDEAERLFHRRLDDPSIIVSRGFETNFIDPSTDQQRRITDAIEEHRSRTSSKLEMDLFSQKTRLADARRSLQGKETKKAREDIRIASNKIELLTAKLSDLRRGEPGPEDNRIFPFVYAGVIIKRGGDNILTPMRYHCRPAGTPAFYDKKFPGLYNARRDNLQKFWRVQFGTHHALMVAESFYENVHLHLKEHRALEPGETARNVVLQFTPEPPQAMLIACLYSHWTDPKEPDLRGFAAITDDPPADVATAGHDRCIINLRPEHVEAWLTPENRRIAELQAILSDRAVSTYQHALEAA
ncbi:MAG TPA: SOS response-associated peptidase family protein [Steroidobacteraceae bacterium]|nr:SOS response-associated peptidase family protein [Steroidobacteraceae bacterium]